MSQVRESLNPGLLEGDHLVATSRVGEHVQSGEETGTFSADDEEDSHSHPRQQRHHRQRSKSGDNKHAERKENNDGAGDDEEEEEGNHDSDPPIENQNPEDGDSAFEEIKHFVDGEGVEGESENPERRHSFHQRKRKNSIRNSDGVYVPPYKKNRFRRQVSVLPSKFLLGGNIRDPLNLASLADAKINAEVNKVTPQSSPLPIPPHRQGPLPVMIPRNPDDPLGLAVPTDNPHDIIAGVRKGKHKKRHRKRHGRKRTDSECSVASTNSHAEDDDDDKGPVDKARKGNRMQKSSEMGTSFETSEDDETESPVKPIATAPLKKTQSSPIKPDLTADQGPSNSSVEVKVNEPETIEIKRDTRDECKEPGPSPRVTFTVEDVEKLREDLEKNVKKKETTVDKNKKSGHQENGNGKDSMESRSVENQEVEDRDDDSGKQSGPYPCKSSEYVPLSSTYAPSPYIFDPMNPEEIFEVKPFESPSLTNYCCNAGTPSHLMEPFSPPPRPEIPHFQRRMQMMSSAPHRHQMSLQRAVFHKPIHRRRCRFRHKSDPIVSPVIPQPGCSNRRNHHHHNNHNHRHNKKNDKQGNNLNTSNTSTNSNHSSNSKKGNACKAKPANDDNDEIKTYRPKDEIYQFGNYKQYYGYRTTPDGDDSRLWVMKKEWFRGKDVLDIGCNIGHVTLSIARDFEARRVCGIDIDNNLIQTARKNIKHYMIHDPSDKSVVFPHSLPMIYGALQPPSGVGMTPQHFPFNVMFSQENYVLNNDASLENIKPEYDVIICLSVTKWMHLNFGDDGLKRVFRRMYRNLRKGGKLILEPQEWSSYYRKRKLTPKISENYKNIKFKPEHFQDFLVKEVGFTFVQKLGTPHHSKGFQRPILIFCKESKGDSPPTTDNNAPVAVN